MFGGRTRRSPPRMVVPTGKATRVDGGYRGGQPVPVRQRPAHASWIGSRIVVVDDNGEPVLVDGEPQCRIAFCPATRSSSSATGISCGMVGTGSMTTRSRTGSCRTSSPWETFATVPTQAEPVSTSSGPRHRRRRSRTGGVGLEQRALQEIAGIVNNKIRPGYDGLARWVTGPVPTRLHAARGEVPGGQAYVYEVFGDASHPAAAQGTRSRTRQRAWMRQATTWQEVTGEVVMFAHRWAGSATVRNPARSQPLSATPPWQPSMRSSTG